MSKRGFLFTLLLLQYSCFLTAAPASSENWLNNMFSRILTCDLENSCQSKGICKIEIYANFIDWFEEKEAINGFFLWQDAATAGKKEFQNSVVFPATITKNDDSFLINSSAEWAYSGYLTINNISVGQTTTGIYHRPEDGDSYTYNCFRHSDPR